MGLSAVGRVNSLVIDRVSAVIEIERFERCIASSSPKIRVCLTDTKLSARLVMVLYLSASVHRSGRCKERQVKMLIRHPSSPRSGAELSWVDGREDMQARQRVELPPQIDRPRPRLGEVELDRDKLGSRDTPRG